MTKGFTFVESKACACVTLPLLREYVSPLPREGDATLPRERNITS